MGGGLYPEGDLQPGGVSVQKGVGRHGDPPPGGSHCSGRYASYWNAFMFLVGRGVKMSNVKDEEQHLQYLLHLTFNV